MGIGLNILFAQILAELRETWMLSTDRKTLTIARVVANDGEGGHGVSNAIYHRE